MEISIVAYFGLSSKREGGSSQSRITESSMCKHQLFYINISKKPLEKRNKLMKSLFDGNRPEMHKRSLIGRMLFASGISPGQKW